MNYDLSSPSAVFYSVKSSNYLSLDSRAKKKFSLIKKWLGVLRKASNNVPGAWTW